MAAGHVASAAEVSFKGKRINVIIGSQPGGGTDGTTRLVGRFLEKHLPGKPRMIYRNMPAGHGVKASNYFANEVKGDGLTWMGGASSYVDANNLRKKVV
jgi:tripartite-type tricarboxylate transporter receptor subunit TctC